MQARNRGARGAVQRSPVLVERRTVGRRGPRGEHGLLQALRRDVLERREMEKIARKSTKPGATSTVLLMSSMGSSASFVFLLQSAGIELQKAPKRYIRVIRPVEVREGEGQNLKWARFDPYHGFKLRFEIDFQLESSVTVRLVSFFCSG